MNTKKTVFDLTDKELDEMSDEELEKLAKETKVEPKLPMGTRDRHIKRTTGDKIVDVLDKDSKNT